MAIIHIHESYLFMCFCGEKHLQPNVSKSNEAVGVRVVGQLENVFEFLLGWTPLLLGHVHVADQSPRIRVVRVHRHGLLEQQRRIVQVALVSHKATQTQNT